MPAPYPRRHRLGLGRMATVGVLSAALATTGTYVVVQATDGSSPVVVEASRAGFEATPASLGTVEDWSAIAERVSPGVVSIGVRSGLGTGAGSGVVWDEAGHVVTNAHVVAGAQEVRVTLADGRVYDAQVVGADAATDLAVLALTDPPQDLAPITVGDDDALVVGAPVMAVGNPLGLSGTVTTGIVSALDRPVTTQSSEQDPSRATAVVTNAIQTSAPINPGNSGGALVDAAGRLVGINSSIATLSGSGTGSGSIGIGFAIPVGKAASVAEQLISGGAVEHAFLGVALEDTEVRYDGARVTAAGVGQVESGSPAEAAGLQPRDAVVSIDDERVDSALSLVAQVRERTTGDEVRLGYVRDGELHEVTVTLDARPDQG